MTLVTGMQRHIGTKVLDAMPMTRGSYNEYRGWKTPEGEDPTDQGYLVEYQDGGAANHKGHKGYISWSPKDVFEASYRRTTGMSFSMALEAIKAGRSVTRSDWNGRGQFVYLLPGDKLAKAAGYGFGEYLGEPSFTATLVLRNAQNGLVAGWVPSIGDLLADTWEILG